MKTAQRYKLIDGTFRPAQAAQILLSLVKSKIDFHELQKLSNEERFGRDPENSEKRLDELQRLRELMRSVCEAAARDGKNLRVDGWIEVRPLPADRRARRNSTPSLGEGFDAPDNRGHPSSAPPNSG